MTVVVVLIHHFEALAHSDPSLCEAQEDVCAHGIRKTDGAGHCKLLCTAMKSGSLVKVSCVQSVPGTEWPDSNADGRHYMEVNTSIWLITASTGNVQAGLLRAHVAIKLIQRSTF
jgi:hypothetical protein